MAQFDDQSIRRISETVRGWERRLRNRPTQRARWQGGGNKRTVAFELAEDLADDATEPVQAYRRNWSPSANSGWGGYVTDEADIIYVFDFRQVGYWGCEGAYGAAEMIGCDNGMVGIIVDLECPPESGTCGSGSGS